MNVFKIANRKHTDLSGNGGIFYPGRWHFKGVQIIYTAQSRSLAKLEYLAYLNIGDDIDNISIMNIYIPDTVKILTIPKKELKAGWNDPLFRVFTQEYGTNFIRSNKYFALKVPSVHEKKEFNYILNPNHPDNKKCKIEEIEDFYLDSRLIDKLK